MNSNVYEYSVIQCKVYYIEYEKYEKYKQYEEKQITILIIDSKITIILPV